MTQSQSYRERQEAQLARFLAWKAEQGTIELPVQLATLLRPEQQNRLAWLKSHAAGAGRLLEIGCSWGFVSAYLGAAHGVDINPQNIELAKILSGPTEFSVADARSLPFNADSFDVVALPEVLEHLLWPDEVFTALGEALRVAKSRVLITVPDGREDTPEAINKKHRWLCDSDRVGAMIGFAKERLFEFERVTANAAPGFICFRLEKAK